MTKPATKPPPPPADEDASSWAREVWGDMFGLGTRPPANPPGDPAAVPAEDAAPAGEAKKPGRHRRQR
jgi:hypothetical protein